MDQEKTSNNRHSYIKPRLITKFNLVLLMFMLWMMSQLVIPIKFLPVELVLKVEGLKVIIPIVVILISILLYIDKLVLNKTTWPFALFAGIVMISSLVKYIYLQSNINSLYVPIMYVIWVIVMFVLSPTVFNSILKIRVFLRCIMLTFIIFIATSILLVNYFGIDSELFYSDGRFEFIYGNPLYLAGVAYSIVCCSLMLIMLSNSNIEKKVLLLFIICAIWVIFIAYARTFMVAALVLTLVYGYNSSKNIRKLLLFSFPILILVLMLSVQHSTFDTLNDLSSNRFLVWSDGFFRYMNGLNILFGANFDSSYSKYNVLEGGEHIAQSYQRFSIDNGYLMILIKYGLVSLLFFIWGLINLYRYNPPVKFNTFYDLKNSTKILSVAYGVLASIIVSSFFYGYYPSLGNTMNSSVLPVVISIIFILRKCHVIPRR